MASTTLNEYERKRLDNIRWNTEIKASLNLHSLATDLSASTKRHRNRAEPNKAPPQKKPKSQTPNLTSRRSMRKSGILADFEELPNRRKNR
ncbi:hypothetical protein TIFTF001_016355 [Ficus carica]|uniref:Uncharacterized protein n=1 Tax=Ficus carica TaxID=3494 RepID=A0AA88D9T8_FICCA|nr:hypothetical protein TIFTF001_016355 [Ficus carica]